MNKKLQQKAAKLFEINEQIKVLTEQADKLKSSLRLEMSEDIEFKHKIGKVSLKVICKKVVQPSPVINNEKLYGKMTIEEIIKSTKPILSEVKKIFPDSYDELIEESTIGYKDVECIKFKVIE